MSADITLWLAAQEQIKRDGYRRLSILYEQSNPSSHHWVIGTHRDSSEPLYFVKQHVSQKLYQQERDALILLAPYAKSDELYAVPKLRASDDRLNCIALNWIDGRSVGRAIRAAVGRLATTPRVNTGLDRAYRVGCWLRKLNKRTQGEIVPFDTDKLCGRFVELLDIVGEKRGYLIPDAKMSMLARAFEQNVALADPGPSCLVHKDFWFDHIWTCGHQLMVLDFGRAYFGPGGRDAVQFCSRLKDLAVCNPRVSRSRCENLVRAFVEGYGSLDFNAEINRMWHLMTRAEQLAGLVEQMNTNSFRDNGMNEVRAHFLSRALLAAAE